MPHPNLDKIEIVEPPIEELTKQPSVWKRAAALGCGGLILVLILLFVGLKISLGPGPSTLRTVPSNFPSNIPIYDKENIDRITFIFGRYKDRAVEIAALFPKIILAPLFISLDNTGAGATNTPSGSKFSLVKFWQVITTPVGDAHDTVQIEWRNVDAGPQYIYSYFKNELLKNKYTIDSETKSPGFNQFTFSTQNNVSGLLLVQADDTKNSGTDYVALTVNLPAGLPVSSSSTSSTLK